jgi:hypothetical protein
VSNLEERHTVNAGIYKKKNFINFRKITEELDGIEEDGQNLKANQSPKDNLSVPGFLDNDPNTSNYKLKFK